MAVVIKSFQDEETRQLFLTGRSRRLRSIERQAARRLGFLDFAKKLEDLREPPGNQLEKLRGDRAGQHSIRINDQFRVCFRWHDHAAWDVMIVDYHR